ncbi:uncharacterized protein [Palaemon carinicauda]|uniref:uncharacterized protein n=1 Tax=Palaemon carinicauda TaxID=392227 RepID=UPI0035B65DE0
MALSEIDPVKYQCGCVNSIFELRENLKDIDFVVKLLQEHGVISREHNCGRCDNSCQLDTKRWVWRCQKKVTIGNQKAKKCNYSVSVYKGGWLSNAKVKAGDNLFFSGVYLDKIFSYELIHREIGWTNKTIVGWSTFIREVLENYCELVRKPIGGPGLTVEIDESKFGKRRYHKGVRVDAQWVFGGICRETREFFAVPVETRDRETLLALIKKYVVPGSTIISDCWKSYNCLGTEGFDHLTVNHTFNFVDPETGAHTNTIKRQWRSYKEWVPKVGRKKYYFRGYLARFYFFSRWKSLVDRYHHFLLAVAALYPPTN